MKRTLNRCLKILSLLIAVGISLGVLQEYILCNSDHNRERVKGFYLEKDNSIDVVFIGASEAYSDFAPGYAYDNYGFTSYLYATQSSSILTCKYQLKEVLKTQKPKLIVIELNSAVYGSDVRVVKEANVRHYIDNIPLSTDKLEFVHNYAPTDEWEYMFPIIKYHEVWKNIPENTGLMGTIIADRLRGSNFLKGIKNETKVYSPKQKPMNESLKNKNTKAPLTKLSETTLRDLLSFCRQNKLDNVVFARFPHAVVKKTVSRFSRSNTVADIVSEYGYDYLNFEKNYAQAGINLTKDFFNMDHLNIYGQRKFTDFFSKLLTQRYGIKKSGLSPELKKSWETSAKYYNAYYRYSDSLIKHGIDVELDEGVTDNDDFKKYLKS